MHKIQTSFNSGEWAPNLYARVDLEKYKSAAALLRNFFVDYRGGASTRPGTGYVLQAYKSSSAVRLIPFQVAFDLAFVLEFGDQYIRFHQNGAPILESDLNITGVTKANPCVVSVTNSYSVGDWVYISDVGGMTQLNGRYFIVHARAAGSITLYDLFGNPIDSSAYGTWTSGGTVARVYTIASPYSASDLFLIKYAQNITDLILCHPSYVPYILTNIAAANWILSPIIFGSNVTAPTGVTVSTTLSTGTINYSYVVTAVDINGEESLASSRVALSNKQDLRTVTGSNTISWSTVPEAVSYNVYKTDVSISNPVPIGMPYGFIGNVTGVSLTDSNISADFSQGPPIERNPFVPGASVISATVTIHGSYTTIPAVTFTSPSVGRTATGSAVMSVVSATINNGGTSYHVGDTLTFTGNVVILVTGVVQPPGGLPYITAVTVINAGTATALPTNPASPISTSGSGTGATFNFTWGVSAVLITSSGSGYTTTPTITFSSGTAAATAVLSPVSGGNPSVPAFFQQRLVLAALTVAPQTLYFSQPVNYYNFNISNPVVDSDAITGTLASGQLNNIRTMVPQSGGLIVFTDGASWMVNGGSQGSAITPASIVANPQSYDGSNNLQPIVANYDVLFTTSKGNTVRDSTYNFYTNVFTGIDISVLSSHLFFGYTLVDWCWAQEPYKVVWAVRNDGTMLTLTFVKDQDFIAWTHSDTLGTFESVCSVIENTSTGHINAVYTVVNRTVNSQTVRYIERVAQRESTTIADAWCVDSGLQYSGTPIASFQGAEHLGGLTCTGLADGEVIPPFTMPTTGMFTIPTAASIVTIGLPFTAQLQTMGLDLQAVDTIQGKPKSISSVVLRVVSTLGLKIGSSFNHLVAIKDLVVGNVNSMLLGQDTQVVSDLYTGDARAFLDATYTIPGQYCIQQDQPLPATITGVIPQFTFEQGRGK